MLACVVRSTRVANNVPLARIEAACYWFLALEKVCQMQLLMDAAFAGAGHGAILVGEEEARFTVAETGTEASGRFHFQPYREEVDVLSGGDYKI